MRKVKSADKLHGSHRPELILVSVASRSFKYGYFPSLDDGASQVFISVLSRSKWNECNYNSARQATLRLQ